MKAPLQQLDDMTRRDFVTHAARAFLGVSVLPALGNWPAAAATEPGSSRAAMTGKNVIYLFMAGGMSHLDTFDPKPESDVQGPVKAISTNADGIQISEYLPRMVHHMDKVAVIRSLHSTQGAHEQGRYYMHTSYILRGTIRHPSLGAWVMRLAGRGHDTLPGNVVIGGASREAGSGFMETKYAPVVIGNPNAGLQHSRLPQDVTQNRFHKRMAVAGKLDRTFRERYDLQQVRAYTDMYQDAINLMNSKDLAVFDISREKSEVREAYGENGFGQGCLLARRLVAKNVRFVEVSLGGWDTHTDNFEITANRAATLDQALSTLLADLQSRGLLEQTLVVLATEFGRTPLINENAGRDHHNKAFSCLLAGGGIKGGRVYGRTDERGSEVDEDLVKVPDFNATIAHAVGLPVHEVIHSPEGRPFTVAHKGKPLTTLFS